MYFIGVLDFLSVILTIGACFAIIINWRHGRHQEIRWQLIGLLSFAMLYYVCLLLEWTNITLALEKLEDLIGTLIPIWWAFVFYVLLNSIFMRDLHESEAKFATLFASANDGLQLIDVDTFVECNNRSVAIFGCDKKSDIMGHTPVDFSPEKQPDGELSSIKAKRYIDGALAGKPQCFYWKHKQKHGALIDTEVSLNRVELNNKTYVMAMQRDITQSRKAEIALRESEGKFRTLFESANDGLQLMEGETFIECNSTALEIYGCDSKDDMIGHTPIEFSPEKQPDGQLSNDKAKAYINAALAGTPQRFYWKHIKKNGMPIDVEVSLNKVELGDKTYILAMERDITQRMKAEVALRESEIKNSSLLENSPVCTKIVDLDFNLQYMSCAGVKALKIDDIAKFYGKPYPLDFYPEFFKTPMTKNLKKVKKTGKIISQEAPIYDTKGNKLWFHSTIIPVNNDKGQLDYIMVVSLDVTERKKAEDELRRNNEMLEEKIEERTGELKSAKEQAESANQAKSFFLSKMSHEIRTPMNAILGFSQLMRRDQDLSVTQDKYLTTINSSGEHLLALINDVLEMSKIESGCINLQPEALDFYRLINDLVTMFKLRSEAKNLQLDLVLEKDVPQFIVSDGSKLREVIINLLSNAVKFTDQGGIVVRVDAAPEHNNQVKFTIEVEDTGCGISQEDVDAVFTVFEQADKEHWHEGTGLGMPISRQFARMMDGDLTINSQVGKGSIFIFSFSAQLSSKDKVQSIEGENKLSIISLAPGQKKFNILIADDDESNLELLNQLLKSVGFETCEAHDGEEVVEVFKKENPDAVLMDYHMPKANGFEAIKKIRSLPTSKDVPMIIVTASALDQSNDKAVKAGADALIKKPYIEDYLLEKIKKFLNVKYIYDKKDVAKLTTSKKNEDITKTAKNINKLPEKLIDEMHQAVLQGNQNTLLKLIDDSQIDPKVAKLLRSKAESFEYENLDKLLTKKK